MNVPTIPTTVDFRVLCDDGHIVISLETILPGIPRVGDAIAPDDAETTAIVKAVTVHPCEVHVRCENVRCEGWTVEDWAAANEGAWLEDGWAVQR